MYKSLKSWMSIPYTLFPFDRITATGTKLYREPKQGLCYAEGKVTVVRNKQGKEVVSNTRLYIDGASPIAALDKIVFEGAEHEIQAISVYYDRGKSSLRTVYL